MNLTFLQIVQTGEALFTLIDIPMKCPVALKIAQNIELIKPYYDEYLRLEASYKERINNNENIPAEELEAQRNILIDCPLLPISIKEFEGLKLSPRKISKLLPIITLNES